MNPDTDPVSDHDPEQGSADVDYVRPERRSWHGSWPAAVVGVVVVVAIVGAVVVMRPSSGGGDLPMLHVGTQQRAVGEMGAADMSGDQPVDSPGSGSEPGSVPGGAGGGLGGGSGGVVEPYPGFSEPGYSEPGYSEPGYSEPGFSEPGYFQPGDAQPGYSGPGYSEPGYSEPGDTQPGYSEPGDTRPGYSEPGGGQVDGDPGFPGGELPPVPDVIGLAESEAFVVIKRAGFTVRVVARDGEMFMVTKDFRSDRVNVVVNAGVVTDAYMG